MTSKSLYNLIICIIINTLICTSMVQGKFNNNQLQYGQDYVDVPLRASYQITGDDNDGYLEDGIIVATKGTGFIDPKYRRKFAPMSPMMSDDFTSGDFNNPDFDSARTNNDLYENSSIEDDSMATESRNSVPAKRFRRYDRHDQHQNVNYYWPQPQPRPQQQSRRSQRSLIEVSESTMIPAKYYYKQQSKKLSVVAPKKKYLKTDIVYGRRSNEW